ncbi:hypothetical protein QBC98_002992 [Kitasatospora acidiphila]
MSTSLAFPTSSLADSPSPTPAVTNPILVTHSVGSARERVQP